MFRPAARVLARAPGVAVRGPAGRRLISTAPTDTKSRSWKNTVVRLGLAVGAVYYYNTSNVFSEQASFSLLSKQNQPESPDESSLPTLDSIKPRIRKERETAAAAAAKEVPESDAQQPTQHEPVPASASAAETALNSPQDLEDEASHEAAFNPETGEINWDCPCLGGMAHGPCGEEFKAAFSCFVYSTEEPKGMDCIDKFKDMQECFRKYPEVYGAELEDDEEAAAVAAPPDGGEQPESIAEIDASYPEVKPESQEPIPAAETTDAPQTEK